MIQQNAELAAALRRLQESTKQYLAVLREVRPTLLTHRPLRDLGDNSDFLLDLILAAEMRTEWGTPAAIEMAVTDLLEFIR